MDTTRRDFLTTAVTAAGAAAAAGSVRAHRARTMTTTTTTRRCRPDLTLRVKSLESLLVEKGLVDPARRSMRWSTPTSTRSARATARAWWRGPGPIPPTSSAC